MLSTIWVSRPWKRNSGDQAAQEKNHANTNGTGNVKKQKAEGGAMSGVCS